ncbi:cardiolipin synthase [[Clostridium] leptum]|nr:cardiolipin synthase [[Clostridium] leptum]CZT55208.1 Major cardiolipin synthase ClsA [Eubacteriaceae bacterium CHKCI005]
MDKPKRAKPKIIRWAPAALLILAQVVFVIWVLYQLTIRWSWTPFLVFEGLAIVMSVRVAYKQDNPSYKISWIIVLLLLPFVGLLLYLFMGRRGLPFWMKKSIVNISLGTHGLLTSSPETEKSLGQQFPMHERESLLLARQGRSPLYQGTSTRFYPLGELGYQAMLEELEKAQRFIFLEYFIVSAGQMWDGIHEILRRKAKEGVDVRLMYDDFGSMNNHPKGFRSQLTREGIQVRPFNRIDPRISNFYMNYRDHRKILVIDGNVGFTGGVNLADEYINVVDAHGHWKDCVLMLKGEAVWSFTMMFLGSWHFSANEDPYDHTRYLSLRPTVQVEDDGFVQPYGDSPLDNVNPAEGVYMQMIYNARRYVYIATPYLILDNEMVTALCTAASSGVDVRIVTPAHGDHGYVHMATRSSYGSLLEAGVRIYEYTPGFIHSKLFVSDDQVATVGSVNMDFRSFYLHFECGVWMAGSQAVTQVRDDMLSTMEQSEEILYEVWKRRPWYVKVGQMFLHLIAPMM